MDASEGARGKDTERVGVAGERRDEKQKWLLRLEVVCMLALIKQKTLHLLWHSLSSTPFLLLCYRLLPFLPSTPFIIYLSPLSDCLC